MEARLSFSGRGASTARTGMVLAAVLAASGAGGAVRGESIVVGGSTDAVALEALLPPPGVTVHLRAPPSGPRYEEAARYRAEVARQLAAQASEEAGERTELVVPYAGGPLPAEALDPPPDTVVLLEHVAGTAGALGAEGSAAADAVVRDPDIVVEYTGGPLPAEATSPPPAVVVGLLAPTRQADEEADAGAVADSLDAEPPGLVVDVRYTGGALPPEALDPPPGTVVRLAAPPDGAVEPHPATDIASDGDSHGTSQEVVVPYRRGMRWPAIALSPPPGVVVKLRAP